MDGNNFGNDNTQNNDQNNQYFTGDSQPANQYNNYQDNTANNMYYQAPQDNGMENKANGMQIAGLVLGIVSICFGCCGGGIIFGVVGLILSILGNKEKKHNIGTAGLVCSIIGLILSVIMMVFWFFVNIISYV